MCDYNRAINAALLGWFLNLAAFGLNLAQGGKLGAALVLASFACTYFAESFAANGEDPKFSTLLFFGSVAFTVASLSTWLIG